jgi:import receptor subunit TOM70
MDAGKVEEALKLFEIALGLDPTASDALLHRANLYMLQQKVKEAKLDLERCLELRPDSILARLRLATILMASEDLVGATKCLDIAEKIDPESSEVHSYRGELLFAQGDFDGAKAEFNLAIKYDAGNPSPYVNAALVVLNTAGMNGGPPNISDAIQLLEKAVEVDPQFQQAYLHLGQLKLSMATTLSAAREVVLLYDKALEYCRAAEELKDIVSMRILTVAQIEAARLLKMETLSMQ